MKKFFRGLLNILLFPFRVIKNMFVKKKETNNKIKVFHGSDEPKEYDLNADINFLMK